MARVRILPALSDAFVAADLSLDELSTEFSAWKDKQALAKQKYGDPDHVSADTYSFGKDGLNLRSQHCRHVHMVPLFVPEAAEKWDKAWEKCRKRVSDRYLFYADGGVAYGFLLIEIIDDPGGHDSFQDTELIGWLEGIAEDFCLSGIIPS